MENFFGQHGWKEFNRNRKDILSELDKILEQIENRSIQTAHGLGVEAYLRKWLTEFLPKKYGVTSGYIIPNLYDDTLQLNHFDIIIYNLLEAPVLWTEANYDQSEQGKFRAIPAKHVVAVYEVKARLTKKNVTEALAKLKQTEVFTDQLNPLYSCGLIFIDLKENENNSETIVQELIKGKDVFKFFGGIILRYEGDHSSTGRIRLFDIKPEDKTENHHCKPIAKPIDSLNIYMTEEGSLEIAEQGGGAKFLATSPNNWSVSKTYGVNYSEGLISVHIDWSRSNFADFCIDMISTLDGLVLNDKDRPSFGQVFDRIERKRAPLQSGEKKKGKPHLRLSLHDNRPTINKDTITFIVSIKNEGEALAILSDDGFKTKCELPVAKSAVKPVTMLLQAKDSNKSLLERIKTEPLNFPYRVVYYSDPLNKEFISIESQVSILKNEITMTD
jgi:hypothetical protein